MAVTKYESYYAKISENIKGRDRFKFCVNSKN